MAWLCLFTALASCNSSGRPAPAGTTVEWKFAIEEVQGSVQDAYAQEFKRRIEERLRGRVGVTIYPYGTLGTSEQITELVHLGAVQFAMASPGHLGRLIPEIQLFLLHFVFSDDNEVNKAVLGSDEVFARGFARLYEEKGLRLLSLYPEGWQVWTTRKPIRTPADFAGLKMRVMTSPLLIEAYRAYGANPTPLPYGEVYGALQLGMIDAQVNPVFAIEEMNFYEVTDYLIFPKHAQFVTSVVTNPRFLDALPPAERRAVAETVAELNDYIFEVQAEYNAARLAKMRSRKPDLGVIRLTAEEREAFRVASLPVRKEYVELVGPSGREILDMFLASVRRAESSL